MMMTSASTPAREYTAPQTEITGINLLTGILVMSNEHTQDEDLF